MNLAVVFPLMVYLLSCGAGMIFSAAEGTALGLLSIPIAAVGYVLCEVLRRPLIAGPYLPNLCGVGGLFLAALEFFSGDPEGKLLSGAHLVLYLNWVVLLQPKNENLFWAMCALGTLQVAVAAVLTKDPWYGMALLGYTCFAVWTLALFSLYQAKLHFEGVSLEHSASATPAGTVAVLAGGGGTLPVQYRAVERTASLPTMRTETFAQAQVRSTVCHDGSESWVNAQFVGGVSLLIFASLVVCGLFFLFIPRVWIGQHLSTGDDGPTEAIKQRRRALSGFADEVRLGDMGTILENLETVMTVEIEDQRVVAKPLTSVEEFADLLGMDAPYFRGAVLSTYDKGGWRVSDTLDRPDRLPRNPSRRTIKQHIVLEPIGTHLLFCMGNPQACELQNSEDKAFRGAVNQVMFRDPTGDQRLRRVNYTVASELPVGGATTRGYSLPVRRMTPGSQRAYLAVHLAMPKGLERLEEFSQQLVNQAVAARGPLSPRDQAQLLEAHLRDSGQYSYTLDLSVKDATIDPVEDFLFNRKAGHCEYYASALALMLRSVNIPSRVVSGFKGGERNVSGQFEVQQRHAHAWVEALIDNRWINLDATPPDERDEVVDQVSSSRSSWQRMRDATASVWANYFVNFSSERQQDEFYTPLQGTATNFLKRLQNLFGFVPELYQELLKLLRNPREWFSIRGLTIVLVLGALGLGLYYGIRAIYRFFTRAFGASDDAGQTVSRRIEFYERLTALLKSAGYERSAAQTPQEFSAVLLAALDQSDVAELPGHVIQLFYKVRYGDQELTEAESARLSEWLNRLEATLVPPAGAPRPGVGGSGPAAKPSAEPVGSANSVELR